MREFNAVIRWGHFDAIRLAGQLTFHLAGGNNQRMRWIVLCLLLAGCALGLFAQDQLPTKFTPAKDVKKKPPAAEQSEIRKQAAEWIGKRATVKRWKPRRFEYAGEFYGRPADDHPRGDYAIYRFTFQTSPEVGREPQADMLFYAQGKELIWPPEQFSRTRPPPGQMMALIRDKVSN